jgi:hypothetical protein
MDISENWLIFATPHDTSWRSKFMFMDLLLVTSATRMLRLEGRPRGTEHINPAFYDSGSDLFNPDGNKLYSPNSPTSSDRLAVIILGCPSRKG